MISKTRLKNILALKHKKFRNEQKLFLIEGYRLCQEAIRSDFSVETLLINSNILSRQKLDEIIQLAKTKQVEVVEIQETEVNRLAGTDNSQGIFCIVKQREDRLEFILNHTNRFLVIIDRGQDPGNVGTIIRTCDWFGIDGVFLSKGTVELFNSKVVRSTVGSIFHIPIFEDVDLELLFPRLKQLGYHLFAADINGEYLYHHVDYQIPMALVIGNENKGISKNFAGYFDKTIKIPSYGKAESLNMALAAAIMMSRMVNSIKE